MHSYTDIFLLYQKLLEKIIGPTVLDTFIYPSYIFYNKAKTDF